MFRAFRNIFFGITAFLVFSCSVFKLKNSVPNEAMVEMVTSEGTLILKLYNETPLHRDNFKKLVESKFYDGIKFHRVINGFMAQAGDPNSKKDDFKGQLGQNSEGETIPAEINPKLFHKKGALAAARMGDNVNPEKKSSGSQFYIVQGRKISQQQLTQMESRINKKVKNFQHTENNFQFSDSARKIYQEIGGTPFLDNGYTVFGEVTEGIEIIDKICSVKTARGDRPISAVTILSARIIK
jgi:peptidyl-prolyl cis-trans isomerase B (cyclophilin B)